MSTSPTASLLRIIIIICEDCREDQPIDRRYDEKSRPDGCNVDGDQESLDVIRFKHTLDLKHAFHSYVFREYNELLVRERCKMA